MPDLKTLFHKSDPETSREAAEKMVKSGALSKQEQQVLGAIRTTPGSAMKSFDFTTKDIAHRMPGCLYHKAYDICRKRFSGLCYNGKIERTGDKRDGCCVWRLK